MVPDKDKTNIEPREITQEMKESYIDYAMSVIVSRALPDVRDGLKPVQRRILYAMYEDRLFSTAKFRKSATVVGSTLGRYHPHGDAPVYEALVRMAQDFVMRYPLVQGQGNFGSIDGDPPASMRYTEAKLSPVGEELLRDIEKDTVDFRPNYDGTRKEPVVLPSPLPNLLMQGSIGIAVGMATSIPPHNLSELVLAICYLIDNPQAETKDLLKFIQGPDFPTGGIVFADEDLVKTYAQGRGKITVRGVANIEEIKPGRFAIVITEIPYQVQKSELLKQFARLVEQKKIENIKDIRDESDRQGMRIVIELSKSAHPQKILNALYKFTDLQKSFNFNMLALVKGIKPEVLGLKDILVQFIEHRREVVVRRSKYELAKAKERAHILEGILKCLRDIDKAIRIIRRSENREKAKVNLQKAFGLTEKQALAVLEIRLQQLARMEIEAVEKELNEKRKLIKELESLLKSPKKIDSKIKEELLVLKEKFGDERRTKVVKGKPRELQDEDLVVQEETIIILTDKGFIKRVSPKAFKLQKRGGKGISGIEIKEEDSISHFVLAKTLDELLFFTDRAQAFKLKVFEIPEEGRSSKGKPLANFINVLPQEKILSLLVISKDSPFKFIFMVTKKGIGKRTKLEEFSNIRSSGILALKMKSQDSLTEAELTTGKDLVVLTTKKGQTIIFPEEQVRIMGRVASGVKLLKLAKDDEVISLERISKEDLTQAYLLTLTEKGFAKKTKLSEFRVQNKGGSGIKSARLDSKTGGIVFAKVITPEFESIFAITSKGRVIRVDLKGIPSLSRNSKGVRILKTKEGDVISSAICH